MEERLEALEATLRQGRQADVISVPVCTPAFDDSVLVSSSSHMHTPHDLSAVASAPPGNGEGATLNLASDLGVFPAASVHSHETQESTCQSSDMISRGVVPMSFAEECLSYFLRTSQSVPTWHSR
jgi:hypothetical protein